MKDNIISFETAKLAKQKGFTLDLEHIYGKDASGEWREWDDYEGWWIERNLEFYEAPTQSLLQKWLREKHQIYVDIQLSSINAGQDSSIYWECIVKTVNSFNAVIDIEVTNHFIESDFYIYEQALEQGLFDALKLI